MDNPMAVLNTGACTHVNRATGGESAPDLSLVHTSLVAGADWEVLPLLRSDHCPIRMTLDIAPVVIEEPESKLRWDWRNADWEGYGSAVDQAVRNAQSGRKQPSLDKRVNLLGEFIEAAARTHVGKVRAEAW